jgi:hypothetical protein
MKTVYTAPKISSLKNNGIKDLLYVASYLPELRLVYLTGVPVRIELNKGGYVELNSEEEEIDLSNYNEIFKSLSEFFYGTAYLYGFVNENKLVVYDAFTNDNFLFVYSSIIRLRNSTKTECSNRIFTIFLLCTHFGKSSHQFVVHTISKINIIETESLVCSF